MPGCRASLTVAARLPQRQLMPSRRLMFSKELRRPLFMTTTSLRRGGWPRLLRRTDSGIGFAGTSWRPRRKHRMMEGHETSRRPDRAKILRQIAFGQMAVGQAVRETYKKAMGRGRGSKRRAPKNSAFGSIAIAAGEAGQIRRCSESPICSSAAARPVLLEEPTVSRRGTGAETAPRLVDSLWSWSLAGILGLWTG